MDKRTLVNLKDLQPTDFLRVQQEEFYNSFSRQEFEKYLRENLPEVWEIGGKLYISDHNNALAQAAKLNLGKVPVKIEPTYGREDYYKDDISRILEDARKIQSQGIFTPHDMWQH